MKEHQEQRCVIGDKGYDHPHPHMSSYYARMQKLDSEEGWEGKTGFIWNVVLEESPVDTLY